MECPESSLHNVGRASARVEALDVLAVREVEPPETGVAFAKHSRGQDVIFGRKYHLYLTVEVVWCVTPCYGH